MLISNIILCTIKCYIIDEVTFDYLLSEVQVGSAWILYNTPS